jgi:hypothetical protein
MMYVPARKDEGRVGENKLKKLGCVRHFYRCGSTGVFVPRILRRVLSVDTGCSQPLKRDARLIFIPNFCTSLTSQNYASTLETFIIQYKQSRKGYPSLQVTAIKHNAAQ